MLHLVPPFINRFFIAPEFAARHPGRVSRVALFVPAGLDTNEDGGGLIGNLIEVPFIGDWLWDMRGRRMMFGPRRPKLDTPRPRKPNGLHDDIREQLDYHGYFPALLSSMRHMKLADNAAVFEGLAETGKPVLAFYGTADPTIALTSADKC